MIDVAVFGAGGKMGAEVCRAVTVAEDMNLVAAIDLGDDRNTARKADVVVDFTHPSAVMGNIEWCIKHGLDIVVGTTGFDDERLEQVNTWLADNPKVGVVIASNFSIGAIVMQHAAALAAKYFESVEIIELHHNRKADAPSGTSATTAKIIANSRQEAGLSCPEDATVSQLDGARGCTVKDIPIHSVRMAGLVAHQEVLFGNPGELLTIKHDSLDRSSFMPGVLAAVRAVGDLTGLTFGIDGLLGMA